MTAHTPGPWNWFCSSLWNDDLEVSVLGVAGLSLSQAVVDGGEDGEWVPSEADKRLIAAAPDLLAALIIARDRARGFMGDGADTLSLPEIDAAIAKATGEQP